MSQKGQIIQLLNRQGLCAGFSLMCKERENAAKFKTSFVQMIQVFIF